MNRPIKFRAWDGLKMQYDIVVGRFGAFYVNPGEKGDGLDQKDTATLSPFNTKYSETTHVMQFTGLLDKNGKEIWEADILLRPKGNLLRGEGWQEVKAPVRYIAEHGGFCWADWRLDKDMAVTCEVVGNEYEGDI